MSNLIFDAHIHNKNIEDGGFLIGMEGSPRFEGTLSNEEVLKLHNPKKNYYSFYYVSSNEIKSKINHPLLKYHPRREKYSPDEVDASVKINNPKAVIIDTLNEPFWTAYDYWFIARENTNIAFVFAHSGGYLINEFIKICHFQTNVWIDFALTHTILGKLGKKSGLPYVNEAISYALNSPFKNRILLSSDYPFFNQDSVFNYYSDYYELLNKNFLSFIKENNL